MDYRKLKTMLTVTGHPKTGAYSTATASAVQELNAVNVTVTVSTVLGSQILNATDSAEFSALASTAELRSDWLNLCGIDEINTASGVAKQLESSIFGPGTTTRSNLQELRKAVTSEAIKELGTRVKPGHVEYARNLP